MSFRPLAERILSQVHPKFRLSEDATIIINQLMSVITPQIQPLNSIEHLRTVTSQILPGQLAINASNEIDRTLQRIENTVSAASQIEAVKTGVYEYLLAEILELAGNIARENSQELIDAYIIISAIRGDQELLQLFQYIIPQFPYGNSIDVGSIVESKTQKYNVVPGFVLSVQDYIRAVLSQVHNASIHELSQLAQRFGDQNPQFTTLEQARRGLAESIINYIIQKATTARQPNQNEELGFMDVLAALQNFR